MNEWINKINATYNEITVLNYFRHYYLFIINNCYSVLLQSLLLGPFRQSVFLPSSTGKAREVAIVLTETKMCHARDFMCIVATSNDTVSSNDIKSH